jgi:uroporphyrin-III C-methyltransferase
MTEQDKTSAVSKLEKEVKATSPRTANRTTEKPQTKTPISKTAVVALLLSLSATAGVVGHYFWQEKLAAQRTEAIKLSQQQSLQAITNKSEQETQRALADLKQNVRASMSDLAEAQKQQADFLEQQLASISLVQSKDWYAQEAAYLIRVAVRSLWLEQDARTAIALLKDADAKLNDLKKPEYLPVRQAIRADIATLSAIPLPQTDEVLLSLMTLNRQVMDLPLAYVDREMPTQESRELSEDVADWKDNLKKSWDQFVDDYFTLRPINAEVKPLLTPQYQQHLRQNLSLKLQQTQWAVTQQNEVLYRENLVDIAQWLKEYFDETAQININFATEIETLKATNIQFVFDQRLTSIDAIKQLLLPKALPALESEKSEQEIQEETPLIEEETVITEDKEQA